MAILAMARLALAATLTIAMRLPRLIDWEGAGCNVQSRAQGSRGLHRERKARRGASSRAFKGCRIVQLDSIAVNTWVHLAGVNVICMNMILLAC